MHRLKIFTLLCTLCAIYGFGNFSGSAKQITISDTKQTKILLKLATSNFFCGYFGRYSNDINAPIDYNSYLKDGRYIVELGLNAKYTGPEAYDEKALSYFSEIEEKLAESLRRDFLESNTLSSAPAAKVMKSMLVDNLKWDVSTCNEIRTYTRILLDQLNK